MAFFSVCKAADIVPDTHRPIVKIGRAYRIQKRHPAAVKVRAVILFQSGDRLA